MEQNNQSEYKTPLPVDPTGNMVSSDDLDEQPELDMEPEAEVLEDRSPPMGEDGDPSAAESSMRPWRIPDLPVEENWGEIAKIDT